MTATKRHVVELDGVRGIACLAVLLTHCLVGILVIEPGTGAFAVRNALMQFLLTGVDLFFVLSGFLIGGILLDNRGSPNYFKAFWTRRVARIFPVCYFLLATYAMALYARAHFDLPQLDIWLLAEPRPSLLSYATFLQSIPIAFGGYGGPRWMGITWSLAIEEQFYLVFPFLVYCLSRRNVTIAVIAAIVLAPIFRFIVYTATNSWYSAYVLLPCRMDELALGVLVAIVVRDARFFALALRFRVLLDAVIVLIACLVLFQVFPLDRFTGKYSAIALMFALLILRIFLYEPGVYHRVLRARVLTAAGLISYALYMYHQAVNGLVHGFVFNQEPKVGTSAELIAAFAIMAVAIALATLSYFSLERPIRRLAQRVTFKPQRPTGDASAPPAAPAGPVTLGTAGQSPAGS